MTCMAALGMALGLGYDLLGLLRRGRVSAGAADLLFGVLCAAGMTLTALFLRMNPFRLYAFAGVALGMSAYAATIGKKLRFLAGWKIKKQECVKKVK